MECKSPILDYEGMSSMKKVLVDLPGLGNGVFSLKQAAKLLEVSVPRVRRWAEGYTYQSARGERSASPILQREEYYPDLLSFRDLIELFWVKSYDEANVHMNSIKKSAERLSVMLDTPYPFARKELKEQGRDLIVESLKGLESASKGQRVFDYASRYLRNVEFKGPDGAEWWPRGKEAGVVVDPRRSFGSPIVAAQGIRTDVLYASHLSEGDPGIVARWYDIPVSAVRKAIDFEEWLAA